MTAVPLVDLAAQQQEIDEEVFVGLREVFDRTSFIAGPPVGAFEAEYARFVGARHCVGVANGTDALELAFRAVGVGPGDEVVLPANTFIATAEAVVRVGALPVLVDVDPEYLLLDVGAARAAVGPRTAAVVPVHLFGQVAPVEELDVLRAAGMPVVEDAAQSQGARRHGRSAGQLGTVAATSFYPGKNLGAAGDAGGVTTDDDEIASAVRLMGAHGSRRKYDHEVVGFNSRLDTVQAVVLSAKLRRLAGWNERRRKAAARYDHLLSGLEAVRLPSTAPGNEHVWHLYVVRVPERDRVLAALNAAGVGAGIHYPVPVHLTGAFAHLGLGPGDFPVAEQAAREMISLPMFPHITAEQQAFVVEALDAALLGTGASAVVADRAPA
ncbi:DegT/DnrJ/EryC1/StrS family aminotransferase [Aquipuribacter sp. MA13-6]|uniref:DegT/DnrJ/EryC1/StrS family aminotransferase n=1 Tax=unclassified Aquipuribacter TaxID=2635084 RepID=UPI003EE91077